ncbi:hypothetical protein [Microbacterium sp. NPDC058345]|uniref:hypothetical protein n=1 Tax=Microbacterium sp. NPDC058345 TaxID=3346455 RepID=UPI003655E807
MPELIFIASSFVPWHGLDRLLDDAQTTDADFILHLVGDVGEPDRERANKDPRIRIHGHLDQNAIAELVARSWVGLASFALDRKGMKEACSLKVREYLASGLATYSGHADRFPADSVYYKQGPARFADIITYAYDMRETSREEVRDLSMAQISKSVILVDTHAALVSLLQSR